MVVVCTLTIPISEDNDDTNWKMKTWGGYQLAPDLRLQNDWYVTETLIYKSNSFLNVPIIIILHEGGLCADGTYARQHLRINGKMRVDCLRHSDHSGLNGNSCGLNVSWFFV